MMSMIYKSAIFFCTPWKLYFDGPVCDDGRGIGAVLISPSGAVFEFSN